LPVSLWAWDELLAINGCYKLMVFIQIISLDMIRRLCRRFVEQIMVKIKNYRNNFFSYLINHRSIFLSKPIMPTAVIKMPHLTDSYGFY
jgi:hypothetical protein